MTNRTKQGQIISYRLGLDDGVTHTLEDTGRKFGITRERVRQIHRLYEKEQERSKKTLLEMVDAGIVLQLN